MHHLGQAVPRARSKTGMSAAEWVQVKPGPRAPHQLDRGRWYQVESKTSGGAVTVRLPDGAAFGTHLRLVRIREGAPESITRVQLPVDDEGAESRYVGICPRGHRLWAEFLAVQWQAQCEECREMYAVEDEEGHK